MIDWIVDGSQLMSLSLQYVPRSSRDSNQVREYSVCHSTFVLSILYLTLVSYVIIRLSTSTVCTVVVVTGE